MKEPKRKKMESEDRETLRHISETLDEMLAIQKRPESRIRIILELIATGITILGILAIIDQIRNWIGG
jgi:hypothetical protein